MSSRPVWKRLAAPWFGRLAAFPFLLAAAPAAAADGTCFMGSRECRTFWITEIGLTPRLNEAPKPEKAPFYFHWDVGHMANHGDWAFGGTIFVGADDYGSRMGVKGRVRRWLGPRTSIDVSPGILPSINDRHGAKAPGFTGHVALNYGELVQLTAIVEAISMDPDRSRYPEIAPGTDTALYSGVTTGGYAGLIGTVILGAVAFVAAGSVGG